jgi:hypothetical protein
LRLAASYEIGLVPAPLTRIRIHAGNLTRQQDYLTRCRRQLAVLERARAFAPGVYGPVFPQAVMRQFYNNIRALTAQGRREDAQALLAEAMRYDRCALRHFARMAQAGAHDPTP